MAYWTSRGLRGSAFEELINMTNQLYMRRGLAVIQKVPTPITPTAVSNHPPRAITHAYFEKKSTVDYIGIAGGTALCFDAKETQGKSLPLRNIHPHQVEFMEAFRKQGGVAFLLVSFHFVDEIFFMPIDAIIPYCEAARRGGRKSIPYAGFDPSYRVASASGIPVHYLEAAALYIARTSSGVTVPG